MNKRVDLLVVGAGPAGMAASVSAAAQGLTVALLDEQPTPGGQIYRAVTDAGQTRGDILGKDYLAGRRLTDAVAASAVSHRPGATVWNIAPAGGGFEVAYSQEGRAQLIHGTRLLLATGALERPVPVPGWTLPGVMTAGAGQILLKASGVVAGRAVLAGAGPLLYLLAAQMTRAGTPPLALVETQGITDLARALRHLPNALRGWRTLAKGIGMLADLRRAGVRRFTGAQDLRVEGEDRAQALAFTHRGRRQSIPCDTVFLHQGVVPNTQATRSLGLEHVWDNAQRAFRPRTDPWGETSLPGLFVAGDGAGIAGAVAADLAGHLAGLQIACQAGHLSARDRERAARPLWHRLASERAPRPFLDVAYAPSPAILRPADATIACRCEEVTAGQIRGWARMGCLGPNQTKAFGRVGMGPCQGRYCGLTVTELLADTHGLDPAEVGAMRIRPPLKPITLGEMAALAPSPPQQSKD